MEITAAFNQRQANMDFCAVLGLYHTAFDDGIFVNNLQADRLVCTMHDCGLDTITMPADNAGLVDVGEPLENT